MKGRLSISMKKTVAFSKNAANVFFHILTACNLRCSHCYINPKEHGDNTLPVDIIYPWLDIFASKKPNLVLLGGEPTMHPHLAEVIRYAKKTGYASITVDTNGYLFHNVLEKTSPEELDFISFSLDGPDAAVNDPIRGDGSFDTCINGVKKAVSMGYKVSMIYTVSRMNLHKLKHMVPIVADLGIHRFFIQVIGLRGKSATPHQADETGLQLTREEWLAIIPPVAEKIAENGTAVVYPKVYLSESDPFYCAGLVADNYFIFPNGRVYRCPLCEDYPLHSFEIKNDFLTKRPKLTESDFFPLEIPEGCVMNKLIQPDNLSYDLSSGKPEYKIACCLLKEEITF